MRPKLTNFFYMKLPDSLLMIALLTSTVYAFFFCINKKIAHGFPKMNFDNTFIIKKPGEKWNLFYGK